MDKPIFLAGDESVDLHVGWQRVTVLLETESTLANAVALILVGLLICYGIVELFVFEKKNKIAKYLTLAERDLNSLLNTGLEHGGRRGKVAERRDWATTYLPPAPAITTSYSGFPAYGNFGSSEGFRSAAQELIAANEKDLGGKGAAMGKASITAFLLRELYEGNVKAAQSKIFVETLNGSPPYIAPGIFELIEFGKFDPKTGFPPESGVESWLLKRVVRERQYPRDIQIIKTDAAGRRFRITGREVLQDLTEQKL